MNIWVAASDGRQDLVEKFLNENATLTANSKDPNGYTPIHAAAAYGHVDLLRKLCKDYGGDINVKDSDGDTPLHHCEDANTAKVIIEELNGDATLTNNEGMTPLAVFEEDMEFPELIQYMREQAGTSTEQNSLGIDQSQLEQFKESIRYTLENDPVEGLDDESLARRQKLEQIISGENVEQELEAYIRGLVRADMLNGGSQTSDLDEPSSKRRR